MRKLVNCVAMILLFWGSVTIDSIGFWFDIAMLSILLGSLILCISSMITAILDVRETEVFWEEDDPEYSCDD